MRMTRSGTYKYSSPSELTTAIYLLHLHGQGHVNFRACQFDAGCIEHCSPKHRHMDALVRLGDVTIDLKGHSFLVLRTLDTALSVALSIR